MEHEQFILEDIENFRRTEQLEEDIVNLNLQNGNSIFETCEKPPGLHEINDIINTLES